MKKNKEDFTPDWVLKDGAHIHISDAESGLNGYRCLGCGARMQGVIQRKIANRKSFFRHHPDDVHKETRECVVASKEYRERLARTIMYRLKYVEVPAIYKYPPKELLEEYAPMLVEGKKNIQASKVQAEISFYEDDDGIIHWGRNLEIEERHLLIRPDVTFFDSNDIPILFIEFEISHGITPEKWQKIARLGIDTVRINIPKKPEVEIEKALKKSKNYKWVYNEKEANTEYIPVSRTNTEDISSTDDYQGIIFEETLSCRTAEIRWLIRSIDKCIRSEYYQGIERGIDKEIQRTEENTKREREELGEMARNNRVKAQSRHKDEEEFVDSELEQESAEYEDLEIRYNRKDQELRISTNSILRIAENESRIRWENEEVGREQERVERSIKQAKQKEKYLDRGDGSLSDGLRTEIVERVGVSIATEEESLDRVNELLGSEIEGAEGTIGEEFAEQEQELQAKIVELQEKEERIDADANDEVRGKIKSNARELPQRIKNVLDAQRVVGLYSEVEREEELYKRAKELFNKGTWKTR